MNSKIALRSGEQRMPFLQVLSLEDAIERPTTPQATTNPPAVKKPLWVQLIEETDAEDLMITSSNYQKDLVMRYYFYRVAYRLKMEKLKVRCWAIEMMRCFYAVDLARPDDIGGNIFAVNKEFRKRNLPQVTPSQMVKMEKVTAE